MPVMLAVDTFFLAVLFWIGIYGLLISINIAIWANFIRQGKVNKAIRQAFKLKQ